MNEKMLSNEAVKKLSEICGILDGLTVIEIFVILDYLQVDLERREKNLINNGQQ